MLTKVQISENKCVKYFSIFILSVALLNVLESIIKIIIRWKFAVNDEVMFELQSIAAAIKVLISGTSFSFCVYRIRRLDYYTAHIKPLLFVWGFVLIFVQIIYDITSAVYRNTINHVYDMVVVKESNVFNASFSILYNSTHGFKYMGMFMAIVMGIVLTGVILKDKKMIFGSFMLVFIFMIAFCLLQMYTFNLDFLGLQIGIVWTSVIFHLLNTIGLMYYGMYIYNHYTVKGA